MNKLLDRLQKARQRKVDAGGFSFTIRRPTDLQMAKLAGKDAYELVLQYVVGWNLKEIDVVPGGDSIDAEFSAELWQSWIEDHPDLWLPLIEEIKKLYAEHAKLVEDSAKN